MPKKRIALIAVEICAGVAVALVLLSPTAESIFRRPAAPGSSRELDELLKALDTPFPTTQSGGPVAKVNQMLEPLNIQLPKFGSQESFDVAWERSQAAVEKLRTNSSTYLPLLMEAVYANGRLEAKNRKAAAPRSEQLALAFAALGDRARPLLPKLKDEFFAGRSIGPCANGFYYIGGTDCGLILVSGLTNSNPGIRDAAVSAISGFGTNREVSLAAVQPVRQLLKNDSEISRSLAVNALGLLQQMPEVVIPDLIQVAKTDSNLVLRTMALKGISRFGTNAALVKADLESIASTDKDVVVRKMATLALQAANGQLPPQKSP